MFCSDLNVDQLKKIGQREDIGVALRNHLEACGRCNQDLMGFEGELSLENSANETVFIEMYQNVDFLNESESIFTTEELSNALELDEITVIDLCDKGYYQTAQQIAKHWFFPKSFRFEILEQLHLLAMNR